MQFFLLPSSRFISNDSGPRRRDHGGGRCDVDCHHLWEATCRFLGLGVQNIDGTGPCSWLVITCVVMWRVTSTGRASSCCESSSHSDGYVCEEMRCEGFVPRPASPCIV